MTYKHKQYYRQFYPIDGGRQGTYEHWRNNSNKYHKEDGPARIWRNPENKIELVEWWVNGDYMETFEKWCEKVNPDDEIVTLLKLQGIVK